MFDYEIISTLDLNGRRIKTKNDMQEYEALEAIPEDWKRGHKVYQSPRKTGLKLVNDSVSPVTEIEVQPAVIMD